MVRGAALAVAWFYAPGGQCAADLPVAPQVPVAAAFSLKPTVEIAHPRVFLGDVATCNGMGTVCDEAYGVDLGDSPEPGHTSMLSVERIRGVLAKEWPDASLVFHGPRNVKITAAFGSANEEAIAVALRTVLASSRLDSGERYTVEVKKVAIPQGLRLRPGNVTYTFPDLTAEHLQSASWVRQHLAGSQHLLAIAAIQPDPPVPGAMEGVPDATTTVRIVAHFLLQEFLPVPIRFLRSGTIIQADDLKMQRLAVTPSSSPAAVEDIAQLVGRRLRRGAAAFEAIGVSQVELPMVARRGQKLRLRVSGSGLDIDGNVVLQQAGAAGQVVPAIVPATKKVLRVRIVDGGTADYVL